MRAAIVRLRESCTAAEMIAAEAEAALDDSRRDLHAARVRIAHARQVLRAGVASSLPGHAAVTVPALPPLDDPPPRPPLLRRHDADGLVLAMPTLVRKGCRTYADLESAWHHDVPCWSSGEQHAARFVRHVIDREPFDLGHAMNVWDDAHRAVFLAWARDPWLGC